MVATPYELFVELVRCTFLGGKQVINGTEYTLEPTILRKQDLAGEDPKFGGKTRTAGLVIPSIPSRIRTNQSQFRLPTFCAVHSSTRSSRRRAS